VLKDLCSQPGISPAYLLYRVRKVDAGFRWGPVRTKRQFKERELAERLEHCRKYMEKPPSWWYQVVFYDEFTVYEKPLPLTAIYRAGEMPTVTDPRLRNWSYGKTNKLCMCYAVNAHVGLIGHWWIHSTTGYRGKKKFWVSLPPLERLDPCLQSQLPIRVCINYKAVRLPPPCHRGSLLQGPPPRAPVKVVQPHKHAPLLPSRRVFPAVPQLLLPQCLIMPWLFKVRLAVHLNVHPTKAPGGLHWEGEIERTILPLQEFAFSDTNRGKRRAERNLHHKRLCLLGTARSPSAVCGWVYPRLCCFAKNTASE
jgi:hypothetical protein